jgi:hypothetical protein
MEGRLGEHHAGELRRQSAESKAQRIIAEQLKQMDWTEAEMERRHKGDPGKLALAAKLRRETTLPMKWITQRLKMGTWKSASVQIYKRNRSQAIKPEAMDVSIL